MPASRCTSSTTPLGRSPRERLPRRPRGGWSRRLAHRTAGPARDEERSRRTGMTAAGPGAGPSAAKSAEPIDLLSLEPVGPGRYQVPMPAGSPEGAQVVFGGHLLATMINAAAARVGDAKYVKSMHTIFSPPGSYS